VTLSVVGNAEKITAAIDDFRAAYHHDFQHVRAMSQLYLAETTPTLATTQELAHRLRCALQSWGAGTRAAPPVRRESDLSNALLVPQLHSQLQTLAGVSLLRLGLNGQYRTLNAPNSSLTVADLDAIHASALQAVADNFLEGNTNVTYPMKAILLLTGFSPAFDSQVRGGLRAAGFSGMAATQFSMPLDLSKANGKKVTRLPFLLGHCWAQFGALLRGGIQNSAHAYLADEPGRVFDVLLFMQGGDGRQLFRFQPGLAAWYEIH
jgi:hypothetical protein